MQLEVGGRRIPVATGDTVIGSAPWCAIVLEGEGVRPHHAVVQGTMGGAAIRTAGADAEVSINGVRLGTDPTPVLHGDKIQIFEHEIVAVDPARAGNTQLFDSGAFADLPPVAPGGSLAGTTGGRSANAPESNNWVFPARSGSTARISCSKIWILSPWSTGVGSVPSLTPLMDTSTSAPAVLIAAAPPVVP